MATKKPTTPSNKTEGKKLMSLAELWDDTDPSDASTSLPLGENEVRLNLAEIREDKKKGDAAFITYEIIEGENEGKKGKQMYKLRDADGSKGQGLAFLMRDLALLGHEEVSGAKLKKTLAKISEEQPMVVINAKQNGNYVNYFLQGLTDASNVGDDGGEEAEGKIEEGSTVYFEVDGDAKTGEVQSINTKKGTAKVEDEDGETHTMDLDDLSLEEPEATEEAYVPKVGDSVKFEDSEGDDQEGEVTAVNAKKETADIKVGKKTHKGIAFDEISKVEDDDGTDTKDAPEFEEGDEVTFDLKGKELTGTIESIDGDEATVKVGKKEHTVELSDLTKVENDDDDDKADPDYEPSEGDDVKWKDEDGESKTGTIQSVNEKKKTAKVEDEDGDTHTVAFDDLREQ